MIRESQNEMIRRKNNLDTQKEKQEKALHEKLSQRKKQQMQELVSLDGRTLEIFPIEHSCAQYTMYTCTCTTLYLDGLGKTSGTGTE